MDDSNFCIVLYNLLGDEVSFVIKRKCEGIKLDIGCKCDMWVFCLVDVSFGKFFKKSL